MNCSRCQHENRPGARFCEECATPLARTCANCGAQLSPTARFCPDCAHPVAPAAAPPRRLGSPESYTPKHLAEKILTSRSALEGERKQVTVLFADLKGSMELLAERDPEEARKILDPVLELMMEAVHRYEGTVNQVMGDGIMALFGAPLAHEDHAVRGCYAALHMQDAIRRYAEEARRRDGVLVHTRVGLNSGEVVVRSIGSDLRMDYTAVGQTAHLAARMEQLAMPGSILIAPATLRLAEGYVEVKPVGPVPVKGLGEAIEVFEVVGACSVRSRFQAVARRGLSRFVGRDAEMEALAAALAEAGQGRGQVVAVVGEPGVGKSRLLHELVHSHRTHGWLVLESGAVSYGKATSYLPVIDLLKGYFKVGDRDDQRVVREKVTGKLLTLDRALEAELSPLLALLDLPLDDPQWQALDPPRRRSRTVHAVKRLLVRESQVQPLALAFEDLHWIDSETQALLDSLTESLPAARILVLVNYRPEYQHAWGSKTYYRQLRLDPLPTATTEELLRALLGGGTELESLKRLLVDRTEGNPFFLEESVRTLVESGALAGRPGAYRLAVPVHEVRAPATVQAVLSARIDRLPPEDKRLLETAAVIGKDVPFGLLQHVAELPEDGLRQTLARLQTAEFLYETRLFPDLEYTFKHALTHEVAYRGLTHERRQALHARVVDGIERQWPEGLTERVEVLAHHAVRGGAWEKAVDYLRQAGAKAAARYATREAAELFLQALAALAHLPASREVAQRTIDLHFDLRHCFVVLARLDELGDHLRQAEALAGSIGDQRRLGWAYAYKSWWLSNHPEEAGPRNAIDAGERALAIAAALGDVELELSTRYFLNIPYNHSGNYRRAIDLTRQNIEVLSGEQARRRSNLASGALPSVVSRWALANSLAEIGEFAEGVASIREGLPIPDADDHLNLAFLYAALGALLVAKGDSRDAIEALEHALRLCESSSLRILWSMTASRLGLAYLMEGRTAEALSSLEQAAAAAARGRQGRSQSRVALGQGYLVASRLDDARGQARQALELARTYGERGWEAWSLRLMAEIASHPDALAPEEPSRWYREAIAIADELGMRPLVAHCHLGLGTLYAKTGRREEARQHLASAAAMYREMDMRFWLAKAEAVA